MKGWPERKKEKSFIIDDKTHFENTASQLVFSQ